MHIVRHTTTYTTPHDTMIVVIVLVLDTMIVTSSNTILLGTSTRYKINICSSK